jgi:hypothetical protein
MLSSSGVVFVVIQVNHTITESSRHLPPNCNRFADAFGATFLKQLKRQTAQESFSGWLMLFLPSFVPSASCVGLTLLGCISHNHSVVSFDNIQT